MDFIVKEAVKNSQAMNYESMIGQANIKVIGVGGGGSNMVSWLHKKGIKGAEIVACNTDKQHLDIASADKKFLIGNKAEMCYLLPTRRHTKAV